MIGIRGVVAHREEVPYTNSRRLLGQVDIVFWDFFGRAYAVEITTGKTAKAKKRLHKQVRNAKKHLFREITAIGVVRRKKGLEVFKV